MVLWSNMAYRNSHSEELSEFFKFLAWNSQSGLEKLPSLVEISQKLGMSIASVREQLEVARTLGLVEVKPRTGIKVNPFQFSKTLIPILLYAIEVNPELFLDFSDLRRHIESSYWYEAVSLLTSKDYEHLGGLVSRAQALLNCEPVQIPHQEHREFHMTIFKRVANPFVLGLLDTYWELYEKAELNVYTDFDYLSQVWRYHQKIADAIRAGDFTAGFNALNAHMDLLSQRPKSPPKSLFE